MSNDSIVLELFSRVQQLEEKVRFLEGRVENQPYVYEENDEDQVKQTLITRANSRDYVAERLKRENPGFNIRKACREEGSGLVLTRGQEKELILKYYYSKSFLDYPSGWHTIDISDLENDNFDIYVFTVSYKEEYFVFFFTKEELRSYVSKKKLNSTTKYYFYFRIQNNKIVEVRDDEYDVSHFYNRWNLPTTIIQKR